MRTIVLVSFLICAAYARPDVSLGYNYGADASGAEGAGAGLGAPSSLGLGAPSSLDNAFDNPGGAGSGAPEQALGPVITKKHFYSYSAPAERDPGVQHVTLGKPTRDYQVVFVKSPTRNHPKLAVDFAPKEEKTVIYVLAQKEPEFNPNDIATPPPQSPSKPEVYFVKYRTPEEAARAQQQIQAQYDSLGGSSRYSDEGTAPVNNVASALDGFGPSYLPPARRFRH